jgi:hypothetical protein
MKSYAATAAELMASSLSRERESEREAQRHTE